MPFSSEVKVNSATDYTPAMMLTVINSFKAVKGRKILFAVATDFGNASITKKEATHLLETCEADTVRCSFFDNSERNGEFYVTLESATSKDE